MIVEGGGHEFDNPGEQPTEAGEVPWPTASGPDGRRGQGPDEVHQRRARFVRLPGGDERLPVTRFPAGSLIYTTAGDLAALRENKGVPPLSVVWFLKP